MSSEIKKFVNRVAKKKVYCHVKGQIRNYDVARCSFVLGMYDQLVTQGKIFRDEDKQTLDRCLNHYLELYGHTKAVEVLIKTLSKNLKYRL